MKSLEQLSNHETLDWLMEKENPSVRYFTLTQLLNRNIEDPEVRAAREYIMKEGIVPQILARQDKEGFWIAPGRFYTAKYSGTVWQLMILAELAADPDNQQIKNACEFILNVSQDRESYGFAPKTGKKREGGLHSEVIPCLTGNMIWSMIKLGFAEDERVIKGIEWICKYQRSDDGSDEVPKGWPYDRYHICWGKHSCHMGVIKSLKALSAIPKASRSNAVNAKIEELVEYFLKHHIYKRSHTLSEISKPGWRKPGFPLMYQTDILEILGILVDLECTDPRMRRQSRY